MSTDHLPKPRTATNFSISSSSLAPTSVSAVSSPETNFPASPCMYSALRWERPAVRSVGMSRSRTWVGFGNEGCVVGKRAVNLERMEEAAWPETCCPMIPLLKAVNGYTTSFNFSGLNSAHLCNSITVRNFSSVLMRNASASCNSESTSVPMAGNAPKLSTSSAFCSRCVLEGKAWRVSKRWS